MHNNDTHVYNLDMLKLCIKHIIAKFVFLYHAGTAWHQRFWFLNVKCHLFSSIATVSQQCQPNCNITCLLFVNKWHIFWCFKEKNDTMEAIITLYVYVWMFISLVFDYNAVCEKNFYLKGRIYSPGDIFIIHYYFSVKISFSIRVSLTALVM